MRGEHADVDRHHFGAANDAAGVGDVAEEYVEEEGGSLISEGVVDELAAGREDEEGVACRR